jgi:hypothetical protein
MITESQATICILAGAVMTGVGIFNKTFYAAKGIRGTGFSDKKLPTWAGKLIFLIVGGVFLVVGISYFFLPTTLE